LIHATATDKSSHLGIGKTFKSKLFRGAWNIPDTDQNQLKSVIYLHLIFVSESKVDYGYEVEDSLIEQVSMWTGLVFPSSVV